MNRAGVFWQLGINQRLWEGAKGVLNVRGGEGKGLTRYLAADMFNTNHFLGEPSDCYISHLYLEQKLFQDHLTLAIGKLDLADYFDTNQFGSWDFFAYPLARNPVIPVPYHVLGALARWDILPWLYVQAGIADNDGVSTQTGFNTAFSGHSNAFCTYEVGVKPTFGGRQGTYRFQMWHTPEQTARIDGSGMSRDDWGLAFNMEQPLTDALGVYGRYGYANEHLHDTAHFFGAGLTWSGLIWDKNHDTLGLGVGVGLLSDDYRQAHNATASTSIFEAYYKVKLSPNLAITPDVQLLLNPGGSNANSTAVICGISMELRF